MKITKYPQSCLLIEINDKRLLIDPGSLVTEKFPANTFRDIDGILITHEHSDHVDKNLLDEILRINDGITVVGNESTSKALGENKITQIVNNNDQLSVAGLSVTARELPHVAMPNGDPGPQNTGYVIEHTFFHPGDGIAIDNLRVENLAAPFAGPDISPRDVVDFIRQVDCTNVVPIHYDYFPADPNMMANIINNYLPDVKVHVINNGETKEI